MPSSASMKLKNITAAAAPKIEASSIRKGHTNPQCPQLIAITKMPSIPMVFPYSSQPQVRTLVLRNNSELNYIVKLETSNSKILKLKHVGVFCDAHSTKYVKIGLDSEMLENPKATELKEYLYVYCSAIQSRSVSEVRDWLKNESYPPSDLAYKFSILRSKEFAALETLADLPGRACPLKAVGQPSYKVDDSDCSTAHNIDSDTDTLVPMTNEELLAVLPPDSMIATATDGQKCFLTRILEHIFPVSGKEVEGSIPCGGGI